MREYKEDRKEIAPPRTEFIAEPVSMLLEPEPIRDAHLIVPLTTGIYMEVPEEPKPEPVVEKQDTKESFVFEPPDSEKGALKPPSQL